MNRGLAAGIATLGAIFVKQAFHSFRVRRGVLEYLARLLKPGGRVVIGQTHFSNEPEAIPEALRDDVGWNTEHARYHSPD